MGMISEERLLELAEGNARPTAEEQKFLASDAALKKSFQEYKLLFSDLRKLQAPEVSDESVSWLIPALNEKIAERRKKSLWWQFNPGKAGGATPALAVAASLILTMGIYFLGDIPGSNDYSIGNFDFVAGSNLPAEYFDESGILTLEASQMPDLDLFDELEFSSNDEQLMIFPGDSTSALMAEAVSLDAKEFAQVKKVLEDDGV